ncbi:dimethyl sulfoxide reductase anchor subunit [bacterium]|nr:dimethyl sulfoxide reductase anchor subunit [bacterium]
MNLREWALPVYTILMQLVTGMFFFLWLFRTMMHKEDNEEELDEIAKIPVMIFLFTIVVANLGAHFHLSNPLKSFLALRNFANSWLSREIAFTLLMTFVTIALVVRLWWTGGSFRSKTILGWVATLFGGATVLSMSFIYLLPTQAAWNTSATVFSYFGTTLLLGVVSLAVILLMDIGFSETHNPDFQDAKTAFYKRTLKWLLIFAVVASIWVASANIYQVAFLRQSTLESAKTSYQLLLQLYRPLVILRMILLVLGLACFVICSLKGFRNRRPLIEMMGPVYLACLFVMVGEILERFLFYAVHVRIGI